MKRDFDCIDGPYNLNDTERIGIILSEKWFNSTEQTMMQKYIKPDDFLIGKWFVVGKWIEFDDGYITHASDFEIIGICKERKDADLIILNYK